jgi:hypothetical protein
MDILAHTLWTNAGARAANKVAEKRGKPWRVSVGWAAFFGVAPDFFAFTVPFVIAMYRAIFLDIPFVRGPQALDVGGFDLAAYLYQFSHSVVIWTLVFVLVWVLSRRPRWELLGWLLHILIDIPSHSINFYPTPFLFPISEYRFPYGVSWANRWFMMINYSALLVVWLAIGLRRRRKASVRA